MLPDLKTQADLYNYAKDNGLEAVADVLKEWVTIDQPYTFMKGMHSRVMCTIASMGLEGTPLERLNLISRYTDTKYGRELYSYMWD